MNACRSIRAFTLIELMIAMAIGMLILFTAFAGFRVASQCIVVANRLSLENSLMRSGYNIAHEQLDFWTNLDDPALNALLLKASQNALSLNPSYVPPIYAQADAILWSTMAALPLFAQPTTLAWSDKVTGVGPNPHGPGLLWNPEPWGVLVPANTTTTSAG